MRKISLLFLSLLMSLLAAGGVSAKGSELKFESAVVAVGETDGGIGILTISVHGFDVPVIIDGDTTIEAMGEEILLEDLAEGDNVKVEAFFEDGAIVADEVRLLERAELGQFRLHGELSEVDFSATPTATVSVEARITLLGVDVYVDDETRIISRGMGAQTPASELAAGDEVDVRGSFDGGLLWAEHLRIGARELGFIEVEGSYMEATDDGFRIDLEEGGQLRVIVNDDTVVEGEPEAGEEVRVEGMLNESLHIIAVEVEFGEISRGRGNPPAQAQGRGAEASAAARGRGRGNSGGEDSGDD